MVVERTNNEVIVRLPIAVGTEDLQDFLNYARYKELSAGFEISQEEVDEMASDINAEWWAKNRSTLIK